MEAIMRSIFLSTLFITQLALAGNGTYFLGISPSSKSLGGTGVANPTNSTDAAFKNPALFSELGLTKGNIQAAANGTLIKQNASANAGAGEKSATGKGLSLAPAISAAYQACDNFTVGLAAYTYGGADADFTGEATLSETKVESSVNYIGPTFSYKFFDMWSVGISPHLVYADLALNNKTLVPGSTQSTRPTKSTIAYGVKFGTAVTPVKDLMIGLSFSPKVRIRYKEIADLDTLNFASLAGDGKLDDIDTQDPAQLAMGVSYSFTPSFKLTVDGRYIGWSSADVFRELGWRDQYVLAAGAEYRLDKLALRAGFNYGRSVIDDASGEAGNTAVDLSGHNVNQVFVSNLNLVGFPGISTTHFTVGAGYDITPAISADLAVVYVPKATVTRSGSYTLPTGTTAYSYTGTVSQWTVGLGGTFRF